MKVAIIGDIHGCYEELIILLDKLPKGVERIYSVGDLIDRGQDSKAVVQECINRDIICVKGNHEDMFIDYIAKRGKYDRGLFEINGGIATLESYSNGDKLIDIPDSHLEFMLNMPDYIETDDFILSHAGIVSHIEKTFRDCSERSKQELIWDRTNKSNNLGKIQVFGHTPVQEVQIKQSAINIDTGCFAGNKLSALILPDIEIIDVKGYTKRDLI